MGDIYWVGMDYHKEKAMLAVLRNGEERVMAQHTVPSQPSRIRRVLGQYACLGDVRICYEASSCGYGLFRYLRSYNLSCDVVAPHSLARSAETRLKKTDRLDAVQLARQYRSGGLRKVSVPTRSQEQVRRMVRLLDEVKVEAKRVKVRITLFCLQIGEIYERGSWTEGHRRWLRELCLEPLDREVMDERLEWLCHLEKRIDYLTQRCEGLVKETGGADVVHRLMALKGIQFASAAVLWGELWDGCRFSHPRALMSYVGLDCREHSSGGAEHRGSITRQGNARCRRVLVDAAGAYRTKAASTGAWRRRQKGQSASVVSYSERAAERLHRRYWYLVQKTGSAGKAKVAVARELAGFVWGMMQ